MDFGLTTFVVGGLAVGLACSFAVGLVVGFFSGLLGIGAQENGALSVSPLIPDDWGWFRVENLSFGGSLYTVTYDRDGSRYGGASSITVTKQA